MVLCSERSRPYSTTAEPSVPSRMSEEKWNQQENEILMKLIGNESNAEVSHPSAPDTGEPASTVTTASDISSSNGLSEDNSNGPIHLNHRSDSYISMPPSYEPDPEEFSRERSNFQFRDLLKPNVLHQPYWTCISPNRLGRRCTVMLPRKNIQLANQEIIRLQADFPKYVPSETELIELSKLLLCKRYHQLQAAKFAVAWKNDLSVSSQQIAITVDKKITPINIGDKFVQFPRQQPSSIISAIVKAMRKPLSPLDIQDGFIYIFARPGTPSVIKIGNARNVPNRLREYAKRCHFDPDLISQHFVHHCLRTEKLVYTSVMEHRRQELICNAGKGCSSHHLEWFEIDSKVALSTVERWTAWMNLNPYNSDRLDAFWEINLFEAEQLPNLDAFHQWIEHMTQRCIEKGENTWRGRTDGHFRNCNENAADGAQLSPISPTPSIVSADVPSLVSGTTFSSKLSNDQLTSAVEKFVAWLLKDEVIQPLHVIAIDRIGAERLERNFRRFLQIYSKDLQAEARTPDELQAAQFVRSNGPNVANCLRSRTKPVTKEESQEFQILSTQEPDKDELLKRFGLVKPPFQIDIFNADSNDFGSPGVNSTVGNQSLDDIRLDDNELDTTGLDDFDLDDIERDDSEHSEADLLSLPNLGLVKEFMITSEAFGKLRQNLRDFVFPPRQHILSAFPWPDVEININRVDPTADVAAASLIPASKKQNSAKVNNYAVTKEGIVFDGISKAPVPGSAAPTPLTSQVTAPKQSSREPKEPEQLPEEQRPNWEGIISEASLASLEASLAGGILEEVQWLLDKHFDSVAEGDFAWLLELRDHGYHNHEIAQLLLDEKNDSPWIFFEPRDLPIEAIVPDYHQPSCVHTTAQDVRSGSKPSDLTLSKSTDDRRDSMGSDDKDLTYIEELCGLAGVVPNSRDLTKWIGSVKFVEEDRILTASVSYHSHAFERYSKRPERHGHGSQSEATDLLQNGSPILEALDNVCNAIGLAQRRGICCDSFTMLGAGENNISGRVVEMHRITVAAILDLRSRFKAYLEGVTKIGRPSESLSSLAKEILHRVEEMTQGLFSCSPTGSFEIGTQEFRSKMDANTSEPESKSKTAVKQKGIEKETVLNSCGLAVQFLSLAFLSYIQAHVGALKPFFLDTRVQVFKLLGCSTPDMQPPHLVASLYQLSCLNNMLRSPVLVFGRDGGPLQTGGFCDLLACPEDLVDTWGPGQFVSCTAEASPRNLTAIMIGGGTVKPTADAEAMLHWSNDVEPRHDFSVRFSSTEKILIGGGVKVNTACQQSKSERWSSFIGSLENLGTSSDYWQFTEFQAGIALTGQQFVGAGLQFNKTWTLHLGNSWKRQCLSLIADEMPFSQLNCPWGLQVSFCTGVARRVPLRLLLADVLPTFVANLGLPPGWSSLQQHGIITALEQGGGIFKQWFDDLGAVANSQDLQALTMRLIRHILLVLRDTGIDHDQKTFLIACPQCHAAGQPISMCLPVRAENASLWAQILADSEQCATFACMTTLCLESKEHKCQKTNPWHCPSLDTAVQQLRSRDQPIVVQPAWNLDVNATYWIGKPESGLRAKVMKSNDSLFPRLVVSKSGLPEKTRARLGMMSRLFGPRMERLRERQVEWWPAEDVLVLS